MSPNVWGVAAHHCLQLPPQSGISNVPDYIDLLVDEFFLGLMAGKLTCISAW